MQSFLNVTAACTLAACAAIALPGCLIRSNQSVHYSGLSPVNSATQAVEVGKSTPDDVLAKLGKPNEQEVLSSGDEVWRWNYTKHQHDHARVFLLINSRKHTHTPGTYSVTFRDGVVVSKRWM
ncbi:MAG: hypothetical protein KF859_01630 [Phycisphaeraceae bacterium]|nr:hypothetical protein [Phycisphaeraceae bacterium]